MLDAQTVLKIREFVASITEIPQRSIKVERSAKRQGKEYVTVKTNRSKYSETMYDYLNERITENLGKRAKSEGNKLVYSVARNKKVEVKNVAGDLTITLIN